MNRALNEAENEAYGSEGAQEAGEVDAKVLRQHILGAPRGSPVASDP